MDVTTTIIYAISELTFIKAKRETRIFSRNVYERHRPNDIDFNADLKELIRHEYNLVMASYLLIDLMSKKDFWDTTRLPTLVGYYKVCSFFDTLAKLITQCVKVDLLILLGRRITNLDMRNALRLIEHFSQVIRLIFPLILVATECLANADPALPLVGIALCIGIFSVNVEGRGSLIQTITDKLIKAARILARRTSGIGKEANEHDMIRAGPDCPVCLSEYQPGNAVVLNCTHVYCSDCLDSIVEMQNYCPMCRCVFNGLAWTTGSTSNNLLSLHG